ncbi:hypothetical protein B0H16DRAFT_1463517 [Mycena metata]|uniref:Uncharacterized protein n=1 Tax=Mycena metata TaxID=1033252 RepID=A0AAD7N3F6_9AGAR|nr:hypothetical protein B0H16DRAFT_1463517 [Mycena metata]
MKAKAKKMEIWRGNEANLLSMKPTDAGGRTEARSGGGRRREETEPPMRSRRRRDVSSSGTPSSSGTLSSSGTPSSSANAPLPSADSPTSISVNWQMYGEGTSGYAINHLLSTIDPSAWQRWVTAEISSTQIGGSDSAGSNKDLSTAVEKVLTTNSTYQRSRWIDVYTQFLIDAGGILPNTTYLDEYSYALSNYSAEEVKLVQAYEAAHPTNISSVGVDVVNVTHIDLLTLGWMRYWAYHGGDANCTGNPGNSISTTSNGTSSSNSSSGAGTFSSNSSLGVGNCMLDSEGAYTTEDYQRYLAAASRVGNLAPNATKMNNQSSMARAGQLLKLEMTLPMLNLTMATGGSGPLIQYAPAWTATIVGWSMRNNSGLQATPTQYSVYRSPRTKA